MHEKQLFLRKNTRKKLDFVLFLIEMSLFCGENTDFFVELVDNSENYL